MSKNQHVLPSLPSGSMADIAFLLLTFFLVTTVIDEKAGLSMVLPPYLTQPITQPVNDRNLYSIQVNSRNEILVEGERRETVENLRKEIKAFILNFGKNKNWSVNPKAAVISIKTDRQTNHQTFIQCIDEAQAAYIEIYAELGGITPYQFRKLDLGKSRDKKIYDNCRKGIPMNISIAEPTQIN